jgi:DNA-binding PadR family transcriptional regulator
MSYSGRQRRTTYSISSTGRKTVQAWLDKPVERSVTFESEGLLRLYLSAADGPRRTLAALDAVEAEADRIISEALSMGEEELQGEAQQSVAPLRWRAHSHDFLASIHRSTWSDVGHVSAKGPP